MRIPSYHQGFARQQGQSLYSHLWKDLRGFWAPCLGPTGGTLYDWSPFGNHGTLTNMELAADWQMGQFGYTVMMDGVDEYVNLPISTSLQPSKITMYARIRINSSTTGEDRVISCNDGSPEDYALSMRVSGSAGGRGLRMRIVDGTGPNEMHYNYTPVTGVWTTIAGSWDNGGYVLYLNGNAVQSGTTGSGVINYPGIQAIQIGADNGSNTWNGEISECGIWGRVLTLQEIQLLDGMPGAPLVLNQPILGRAPAAGGNAMPMAMHSYRRIRVNM